MIQDMTNGNPSNILWKFTIPLFLSVVFQQLYSIVDSVVAGRFASTSALAAVGASYPITMIYIAIATGTNIGCSVIISQLFGQKKFTTMKTAINTSLIATLVLSVLLTIFGILTCNPFIRLLGTPTNIFSDSALYLRIYMFGLFFLFLYNICNGIFTALGDSKTPLFFLIISSIGNIILDLLFVITFHMGVSGVAWATFIAQGVSSLLAIFVLLKRITQIKSSGKPHAFSGKMLKKISLIAIPSILQQSFVSVGNLFIQSLVNGFGSDVIAGYSAAIKLNTFTLTSIATIGNGLSSFSAQNIGAGKNDRVKEGFRAGIKMVLIISLVFTFCYFVFRAFFIQIFLESGAIDALFTGTNFLKIVSPFYVVVGIKLTADAVIRGGGAMKEFMISTFSDLILRVILAFILVIPFGSTGIWLSWPLGWIVGALLSYYFYKKGVWKQHRI
ncbi:MAG: MATE family efflux transporter [Velocimicrobium sp.]